MVRLILVALVILMAASAAYGSRGFLLQRGLRGGSSGTGAGGSVVAPAPDQQDSSCTIPATLPCTLGG